MPNEKYVAFLSLGSNVGDRFANVEQGIHLISKLDSVQLLGRSSLYETSPVGFVQQPKFINCVVKIETDLDPLELLDNVLEIEKMLGRQRITHWGARTMDIDILLCGDRLIREPRLKVPHPLMFERGFVMIPLAEIMTDAEVEKYGLAHEFENFKGQLGVVKIQEK